ncbi:proteoglycan 4 [Ceratobasidium sp. AG-Ba]|nr:proteoglycan 4 [Ceratobasidium sp. AG-Ba]
MPGCLADTPNRSNTALDLDSHLYHSRFISASVRHLIYTLMATIRTRKGEAALGVDSTMRDDSMLDSGEESDVMDNMVFRRPVTRRQSKATAASAGPSTSAPPARRRSLRKSSMSPSKRPSHSRRPSQTTSTPSSSPSQPSESQSQSQSQSDAPPNDEPTGMSQEMAGVSVNVDSSPELADAPMDHAEPQSENAISAPAPASASMEMDTHASPNAVDILNATDTPSATLDVHSNSDTSKAHTVVFNTEPVLASASKPGHQRTARAPKPSVRKPLALPVFTVTSSPGRSEDEPSESVLPVENQIADSSLSMTDMASTSDVMIPTSLAPPVRAHTPRRSPRLSGTANVDVSSSSPPAVHTRVIASNVSTASTVFPPLRQIKKIKAKAPTRHLADGPSSAANDAPLTTTSSKGKEKERASSPTLIPNTTTTKHDALKPSQLRSLSPESDAVLMTLHQTLSPPKLLSKSSERPQPPSSAMKRPAETDPLSSPGKRARFDPDPQPPPPPLPSIPKPNLATRPGRIRVHPANSLQNGSFIGAHPPIVVRPPSSPSRQQLLLQRPAGPPMRVPVNQPQRVVFPQRVPSPVRTGSYQGIPPRSSPAKPQKHSGPVWQRAPGPTLAPSVPNRAIQLASQIKPEVLIAPRDDVRSPPPDTGSGSASPGRTVRSRLPVPRSGSAIPRTTGEKEKSKETAEGGDGHGHESSVPPAVEIGSSMANASRAGTSAGTLQLPPAVSREPTPPTPLETPASPGSSSSTLIMDVPLFYQPPAQRLPPIQQRTAEEIIAEGMEREAQRKRERGQVKSAAAAAAALRCVPLARARRIIPNGSALQAWPSVSGPMTESQKELERLTRENTEKNNVYACTLEMTEAFKDEPRPASPSLRVRTKAQKAKETERQERAERAQRRSASRGETSSAAETATPEPPSGHMLAPGDEEVYESPDRPGRRVRWARSLVHDDVGVDNTDPGSAAGSVGRGCLTRTYELDRHGNARDPGTTVDVERVVVVRYVYRDERRRR